MTPADDAVARTEGRVTGGPRAHEESVLSESVVMDQPDRPVAAPCAIDGCHYQELEKANAEVVRFQQGLRALLTVWSERIRTEEWDDTDEAASSMNCILTEVAALLATPAPPPQEK